ncbi:hypothetical protein CLM71_00540 [Serratia sp. MYb239]|uniref:hypothetical protein n=1 Tax=Serratia sp. MYb239 TaxID=2033438 RepID=UPI000CF60B65|nr:hypothetical protein [Serratia sp. MYb239]AVJ15747.1 hypothetical protein CLM71_00540 [Serratia sp. MYb239]
MPYRQSANSNKWFGKLAGVLLGIAACLPALANAAPITLTPDRQDAFRSAFYQAYSDSMEKGGWTNVIKEGRKPKLHIVDCANDLCVVNLIVDAGFDEQPYLVRIGANKTFSGMTAVRYYGRALGKAAFVTVNNRPAIYVTSKTHMGTQAEQLFAVDGEKVGKMLALRTFSGEKTENEQGDRHALQRAATLSRQTVPPVVF